MLPPGIPDPNALQGMVTGKDLKALTAGYDTGSADRKERNAGNPTRSGRGSRAQWGKRSKDGLELEEGWKEEDADWRDQTLALIWRIFHNTFRGSGIAGQEGTDPTEKTAYDESGLSVHDAIWGSGGGFDSDVVRAFSNPFYVQVFQTGEQRFGLRANGEAMPLAAAIFGPQQEDAAEDWYQRMYAASHSVMSFTWSHNGEDPFAYLTAVKNGPHDSLAAASFGTPEIAEALASESSPNYARGIAEAAFGDAAMVTALREGSLARATLGTDAWAVHYAGTAHGFSGSVLGTTDWGDVFIGPSTDEETKDKTVAAAMFGIPELAQRFLTAAGATGIGSSLSEQLFKDSAGVAEHKATGKSVHERIKDLEDRAGAIEDRLATIEWRLDAAGIPDV